MSSKKNNLRLILSAQAIPQEQNSGKSSQWNKHSGLSLLPRIESLVESYVTKPYSIYV